MPSVTCHFQNISGSVPRNMSFWKRVSLRRELLKAVLLAVCLRTLMNELADAPGGLKRGRNGMRWCSRILSVNPGKFKTQLFVDNFTKGYLDERVIILMQEKFIQRFVFEPWS